MTKTKMTERQYIMATELGKLRAAQQALMICVGVSEDIDAARRGIERDLALLVDVLWARIQVECEDGGAD